jgi:predicted RNase H-like HicB family nuclease
MLKIEIEREEDGRWIGEVPDLPGVLAYGTTEAEARVKTTALALRVIADRIEHGEPVPFEPSDLFFAAGGDGRPPEPAGYCGRWSAPVGRSSDSEARTARWLDRGGRIMCSHSMMMKNWATDARPDSEAYRASARRSLAALR